MYGASILPPSPDLSPQGRGVIWCLKSTTLDAGPMLLNHEILKPDYPGKGTAPINASGSSTRRYRCYQHIIPNPASHIPYSKIAAELHAEIPVIVSLVALYYRRYMTDTDLRPHKIFFQYFITGAKSGVYHAEGTFISQFVIA